jgi:hypothetical protein
MPSAKAVVNPTHTEAVPEIGNGIGLTVITEEMLQVVGSVYMMVAVPTDTPPTTPEDSPAVATDPLLLNQVPPPASLSPITDPTHTDVTPLIADGNGLTVTGSVAKQPLGNV